MGEASGGWSDVGVSLADSLATQLDWRMQEITQGMTDAIGALTLVKSHADKVFSGVDGLQRWQNSSASATSLLAGGLGNASSINITEVTRKFAGALAKELKRFHELLKPVLLQVQKWLVSFGDKLQAAIEGFSGGLDVAQKLFDQVMVHLKSPGGNEEGMLYDSYSLFDVGNTGKVSLDDIHSISDLYSISALQGRKAEVLMNKYDENDSGQLNPAEFSLFVHDEAIPGAMAVVLRSYARKLEMIAGQISAVQMHDEVAVAVAEYLALVCAKNLTRLTWVADALTNGSLPLPFTADVLAQLALNADSPNKLTKVDVGMTVVAEMVALAPVHVADAVKYLANASSWEAEGFDPSLQGSTVEQVTKWVSEAKEAKSILPLLFSVFEMPHVDAPSNASALTIAKRHPARSGDATWGHDEKDHGDEEAALLQERFASRRIAAEAERDTQAEAAHRQMLDRQQALPKVARLFCESSKRQYRRRKHAERSRRLDALDVQSWQSPEALLQRFSGTLSSVSEDDPETTRVVNSGIHARPETLQFAKWLAANASIAARRIQEQCFDYTSQSSGAMDSIAQKVTAMVKRINNFLNMLEKYATPRAIDRLDDFTTRFVAHLEENLVRALDPNRDLNSTLGNFTEGMVVITKTWSKAGPMIDGLASLLPTCIDDLKKARKTVSSTSATLRSLFQVFKAKGPPLFQEVSGKLSTILVVYFVVFLLLTIALLAYALWASGIFGGYFGGDEVGAAQVDGYETPSTFASRCQACWASCFSCVRYCDDNQTFFGSVILLMEVLWLAMFVVSYLILMMLGLRAFVSAGCKPVYILGDNSLCTEGLELISTWLDKSDWIANVVLPDVCMSKKLLVCDLITKQLGSAMTLAAIFNTVAALVTFHMIVEAALIHEKHRLRTILDLDTKST